MDKSNVNERRRDIRIIRWRKQSSNNNSNSTVRVNTRVASINTVLRFLWPDKYWLKQYTPSSRFEFETEKSSTVLQGSTWFPRDIILYRMKYVTARLNLNPHDFSKFHPGEIASRRVASRCIDRLASRPDNITHTILRGLLPIPYRGMRCVLLCSTA